jgi:2'-5' RNA ligase
MKDTFASPQWTDNPSLHGGRLRSFDHVRGNWATYVYAEADGLGDRLQLVQSEACKKLALEPIVNPHLSLTRVVTVRHHWIDSFVAGLRESVTSMRPFRVDLGGFEVFVNEERTRTFLGLSATSDELPEVVARLDSALEQFGLPAFYRPASFHISLAWCLGDKKAALEEAAVAAMGSNFCDDEGGYFFGVQELQTKCGKKRFPLAMSG